MPSRGVIHPGGKALERSAVPSEHDLEFLGAMVGRAVILRGSEKACVIDLTLTLYEFRDQLIGRKTAERTVFRRDDDVEAAHWRGNFSPLRKPVEGKLCGGGGDAEGCLGVSGGKSAASAGSEPRYILL